MKIEDHLRNINESISVIEDSIKVGLAERQRNIGFNVSVASAEMLEVYLHTKNLINFGTIIKHEWFSSFNRINEKFPFEFNKKKEIFKILNKIETKRNLLCYGKPQPLEEIKEMIFLFNEIKSLFENEGLLWS